MITTPQGTVEYQDSGTGVPVVFVPGSFSTGASWRPIITPLSAHYRTVTTSLSGYGRTEERRRPDRDTLSDGLDVLDTVLAQVDAPVHLVAHSFGAWMALALAMQRQPRLLSMTLLEPTVFNLLTPGGEAALHQQVLAMTARYEADWQAGEAQAVRHVIDFYGGSGTFDAYPPAVQDKVAAQTATNVLDWHTAGARPPTPADWAAVRVPTLVIYGSHSHRAMQRCNQLLAEQLPHARAEALAQANHFMIGTHAAALAERIDAHIRAAAPA